MTLTANWSYPTSVRFGAGRISEIADACTAAGITNPLLITDRGLASMEITTRTLDLLDAAGLGWTPRPAPDTAIAEVHLSVSRLGRLVALDETDGQPRTLVSEWRETMHDRDGADLT